MRVFREGQRAQRSQILSPQKSRKAGQRTMLPHLAIPQEEAKEASFTTSPTSSEDLAFTSNRSTRQPADLPRKNGKNSLRSPPSLSSLDVDTFDTLLFFSKPLASRHLTVGHRNPLETYSLLGNPTRRRLFSHCEFPRGKIQSTILTQYSIVFCVIAPEVHPLGRNNDQNPIVADWVRRASTEPQVLEAVLFHASVHLDLIQGKPLSSTTHYHRGRVIRQINRLMNSPGQETSDTAILAVGLLAGTGVSTAHKILSVEFILRSIIECHG